MQNLPRLPTERIPPTRVVKGGTDLRQFEIKDRAAWRDAIERWVQDTAKEGHAEILAAGNPKTYTTQINGTTGASGNARSGFTPGPLTEAKNSARVLYHGQDLAETANRLQEILRETIGRVFPLSKTKRLKRDWVWYLIREGQNQRATPVYLGGSVGVPIEIYDLLYLVPEGPDPARYAYMANWNAKHNNRRPLTKRQLRLLRSGPRRNASKNPRDRREGFMAEAARKMRGLHVPGVRVRAVFVGVGLTSGYSKSKWMPAIRLCFDPLMRRAVHT